MWRTSVLVAALVVVPRIAFAEEDREEPAGDASEETQEQSEDTEAKREPPAPVTQPEPQPEPEPKFLTPGQLRCLVGAKNQREVRECLPQEGTALVVRAAADFGLYSDTNAVDVLTPSMNGSISSPTAGWSVNGSYTLDVVSAASPDIVSMASPKSYGEKRHAGTLGGAYKPGAIGVQGGASTSIEPDYVSVGGQIAGLVDLADKRVTPRASYEARHDVIGRGGTPFDVFSHTVDSHSLDLGVTLVLAPTALLLLGTTAGLETGDQSKPYRYVPMFSPGGASRVHDGISASTVNALRLSVRPLEQLPLERWRFATGARLAKRFGDSTMRVEERLYTDSWGIRATTTDVRWLVDLGTRVRVWPHLRLHAQSAASFQRLAYVADVDARGNVTVPLHRTGDRELGALVTATFGGGVRFALTEPSEKTQIGITLQGETMHTRFFDALYVTNRIAAYGAIGFDLELR
jgi:hypothetical protein